MWLTEFEILMAFNLKNEQDCLTSNHPAFSGILLGQKMLILRKVDQLRAGSST